MGDGLEETRRMLWALFFELGQRKGLVTEVAQVRVLETLDPSTAALRSREHSGELVVGRTGPVASAPDH